MIVAGIKENEGTVITRDRDSANNIRKLSKDTWFLVQCNAEAFQDDENTRRANEAMAKLGQNGTTLDTIASEVLLKPPVFSRGHSVHDHDVSGCSVLQGYNF
eukprot:TRINITY_DN1202_c0_g3_i10.p2 TRINITY_DN1202_c0_g3~~TRINITY_DN1202_c0_g3_i10.p2  ORF type:complete len:102 (+),score=15.26 TRINITY_DN1202_c0_g3_i10:86-391(+)